MIAWDDLGPVLDVPLSWELQAPVVWGRCPGCHGPHRLAPGLSVWCWRCRRWLTLTEPAPPLGIFERLARRRAELAAGGARVAGGTVPWNTAPATNLAFSGFPDAPKSLPRTAAAGVCSETLIQCATATGRTLRP